VYRCAWRWQRNPGEPDLTLVSSGLAAGDAGLQRPHGDRQPGHQLGCGIGGGHLQGSEANAQKAHPSPPVGIHLPAQPRQAEGIALQAAGEHGDGDHQQQPIDPQRAAEAAVCQLEDPGFLIAEQVLTAEAPAPMQQLVRMEWFIGSVPP
jgi:hypothetical protein